MRKLIIAASAFLLVVAAAVVLPLTLMGQGEPARTNPSDMLGGTENVVDPAGKFTVHGTLSILDYPCVGTGYSDLVAGAQVVVFDSGHDVIGTGALVPGESANGAYASCGFRFTVRNLPRGLDRYGFHVGNSNRGVIWFSESEADDGVSLSIG